jgi:predicted HD superfamily hydrolase involved in NAD metabolism
LNKRACTDRRCYVSIPNRYLTWVEKRLSPSRYAHTLGVVAEAGRLAGHFGADVEEAVVAGALHDCARDLALPTQLCLAVSFGLMLSEVERRSGALLHAIVGAEMARRECGISNERVLAAIRCHTTGRVGMSVLDKVLFVADYIEPGRSFPGVRRVREAALHDLEVATLWALDQTIGYVLERGQLLHPATVEARNHLLLAKGCTRAGVTPT